MSIVYQLDFKAFCQHTVEVTINFTAPCDAPTLWLPTWIAGSYLIREFAKNVTVATYHTADSEHKRAVKLNKNTWQLTAIKTGEDVTLSYEVYCYDLSVRTAYIDQTRIFANFSSLLMLITGQENNPCTIELTVPNGFFESTSLVYMPYNNPIVLACGLNHSEKKYIHGTSYHFDSLPDGTPLTAFAALDYPFELAAQSCLSFDIVAKDGTVIPHRVFISGVHTVDNERLRTDTQKICQAYHQLLGWSPFSHYTFLVHATGNDYGGLEHINSTALVIPRTDLPNTEKSEPSTHYQRLLGLISHEYFHAWWVKSVRPDVMMSSQLQTEAYTTLLWVFEGFTSYIDDLILYISGVMGRDTYIKLLGEQISRSFVRGNSKQSLAESSFDTWIKLYRPDENSPNVNSSYYSKGMAVALCLDLVLCQESGGTKSLFDVVRAFCHRANTAPNKRYGMSTQALDDVMISLLGINQWRNFYHQYVDGVTDLPLKELLNDLGSHYELCGNQDKYPFGLTVESSVDGLRINRADPDCAGAVAGLSAHDVIIAINGIKADTTSLINHAKHSVPVSIHAFRRDVLMTFTILHNANDIRQFQARLVYHQGRWLEVARFFG